MNLMHDVPLGDKAPKEFNVIIEIPKGSSNKYEIDKETGLIKLDRVLYSAVFYPTDYGFLPQTYYEDGDALDALVLATYPFLPGIIVQSRPVGMIKMVDNGEKDDKLIVVPVDDPRFRKIKDMKDLNDHFKQEIKNFLETYKNLEGKEVKVTGLRGVKDALDLVKKGILMYKEEFSKKEKQEIGDGKE